MHPVANMSIIRSQIKKIVNWTLERQGIVLVRPQFRFGFDVWSDIRRLADTWNYPIALFFDVGANEGQTAVVALREYPKAHVVSFEPHPSTFSKLMAKLSRESRFKGANVALGHEVGEVAMFQYDLSTVASLVPDTQYSTRFGGDSSRLTVQCTTLDSYCAQNKIERIDVLKIDTEGFDLMVLQGSQAMLQKHRIKFIYVEFNDLQPAHGTFGGALVPIDTLLRPYGYRFIASYMDYIVTEGEMFLVSNALFALPPS
jgi:FkbM family methyltransferase